MRFLSSVFVLCVFGVADAHAVPSVKMLGSNAARVGVNTTVVKPSTTNVSNTNPQRLGGVRIQQALPTASSLSGDTSRLGLGKYVTTPVVSTGNVGVGIKKIPVPSKPNPVPSETTEADLSGLVERVIKLENGMELKQDIVSVGDGLIFEENLIELDDTMADLPYQVDDLSDIVNTKASEEDLQALKNRVDTLDLSTYNGTQGVAVDGTSVKLDIQNVQEGEIYIYTKEGWTELPVQDEWSPRILTGTN